MVVFLIRQNIRMRLIPFFRHLALFADPDGMSKAYRYL
ncbi:hypothetical protein BJAB0715_02455 [Acinetobacter baumannii BJAB0715]|nr:hypothetical protein BJAB0715_02455 [Acinetobacter baumannii BJAB0715]